MENLPVYKLVIDDSDELGVEWVALVDTPAIETNWHAFKEHQFESYTDYPKQASENAKIALRWAEENGWGECGEATGKIRANQLAKGLPISRDTIARMASFERHRQNSQKELGDGCGRLMWLAWGGDAGVEWAQRKLKQIDNQKLKEGVPHYTKDGKLYNGPTHKDANGRLMTGAVHTEDSEYLYHYDELIVNPRAGESKDEFVSRCISVEIGNGKEQDQAAAICYTKWDEQNMKAQFKFFADKERRLISGALMISDLPIYRADESGEYYVVFDKEQIEKIAQRFFKKGFTHNVNMMHDSERQVDGVYMVESFIIDKTRGIKTPEGYPTLTEGSWFGTFKVDNNEVWNDFIRTGVFKGFSVEGAFAHRKLKDAPVNVIESIADRIHNLRKKVAEIATK
jgi:hypothetical protein